MQTALDSMGEGVALFDKQLRLRFINHQFVKFHDYPPEVARIGNSPRPLPPRCAIDDPFASVTLRESV
jgi:PAS domain-containing protein